MRVLLAEFIGQAAAGLADDLQIIERPDLQLGVLKKCFLSKPRFRLDLIESANDIAQSRTVVSQSGVASAKARLRTSGRNIRSVATSMRMPSSR